MPICRNPVPSFTALPEHERVRLSRYVVHRRVAPRAANDNRRPHALRTWRWALMLATAPTLTVVLLLSGLI